MAAAKKKAKEAPEKTSKTTATGKAKAVAAKSPVAAKATAKSVPKAVKPASKAKKPAASAVKAAKAAKPAPVVEAKKAPAEKKKVAAKAAVEVASPELKIAPAKVEFEVPPRAPAFRFDRSDPRPRGRTGARLTVDPMVSRMLLRQSTQISVAQYVQDLAEVSAESASAQEGMTMAAASGSSGKGKAAAKGVSAAKVSAAAPQALQSAGAEVKKGLQLPFMAIPGQTAAGQSIRDNLCVMVRDPYWLFCYWELSDELIKTLGKECGGDALADCRWILRLTRLENGISREVAIDPAASKSYVPVQPRSGYDAELGVYLPDGKFRLVAKGNRIGTPPVRVSHVVDPHRPVRYEEVVAMTASEVASAAATFVPDTADAQQMQPQGEFAGPDCDPDEAEPQMPGPLSSAHVSRAHRVRQSRAKAKSGPAQSASSTWLIRKGN